VRRPRVARGGTPGARPGSSPARLAAALAAAAAAAALAGCAAHAPSRGANALGERPVAVQLHVHGHSHHNGVAKPGSMAWHSDFAKSSDYDVLWWSDHTEILDPSPVFVVPIRRGALAADSLGIEFGAGGRGRLGAMVPRATGGRPEVRVSGDTLLVGLHSSGGDAFDSLSYRMAESLHRPRRIRSFAFARPLWSEPRLRLRVDLVASGPDAHATLRVPLSWHRIGGRSVQQSISVRLVGGPGEPEVRVRAPEAVDVDLPIVPGERDVEIPLLDYARLLPGGEDNTVTDIEIGVAARRGATARVELRRIELSSARTRPEESWASLERIAARCARDYGLAEFVGGESNRARVHMNAFLPDGADGLAALWPIPAAGAFAESLVARVHAAGGLVSFNHMFGVRTDATLPPEAEQSAHAVVLAESLLTVRAYGADLLEVGYRNRGGADLMHHVAVWDYLTAHGLYLPGTGVTDSHGDEYGPQMTNPFVTWVWSRGRDRTSLIDALRRGRVTFGDPFAFGGSLDFAVEGTPMGGAHACAGDSTRIDVDLRGAGGAELRLVQALLGSSRRGEVEYVARRVVDDPTRPVAVDTRRPSFVRFELWQEGRAIAVTNPVRLLKPSP
jgi:hypothetical protein